MTAASICLCRRMGRAPVRTGPFARSMRIYGIAVREELLAGGELAAFLGFFDQRYRDHDTDRGRMVARGVLTDPVLSEPGELGPIRYSPTRTNAIDTSLNGLLLNQLPIE